MSRIEQRIDDLLYEHEVAHDYMLGRHVLQEHEARRDAIRAEIVAEFTELLEACIAAYHHAITGHASLREQIDADERMEAMLETVIAKARGEES